MSKSKARKKRSSSRRTSRSLRERLISTLVGVAAVLVLWLLVAQGCLSPAVLGIDPEAPPTSIAVAPTAPAVIPPTPAVPPTPVPEGIAAFFSTPHLIYPDVPEERTPPPHEQALIADLDAARSTILIALYEYDLPSIADALVAAQQRGVIVRVALDRENTENERDAAWAGALENAGIPINWQETSGFLHSKIYIIDDAILWMGSGNATVNGYYRNNNNWLRITYPPVVKNYRDEVDQMLRNRFINDKPDRPLHPVFEQDGLRIETYFAPTDPVYRQIIPRLQQAQESIKFMAFAYTNEELANAMIERLNSGVQVTGVFENRNANGVGSEFQHLADSGVDVWTDGNCYTMHHKVIIIDERTVITGSYNFTGRAENDNDENLLIIDSPELAQLYDEEFQRVYNQAVIGPQCGG